MMNSKLISSFFFCFLILSCASQMIPSGGQKDNEPPKVLETTPNNKELNYYENNIKLQFDEFVELENPTQNINISPYQNNGFKTKIIGKSVIVYFLDSLLKNKTYSILFDHAIKDYTEGNVLKYYNFVFSTGSTIDSGKLRVKVINATNNEIVTNSKVVLVENFKDFQKGKYSYLSKSIDSICLFTHLDQNEYYVFSFIDSNKNNKWDSDEFVGFKKDKINALKDVVLINQFVSIPKKYNYKSKPSSNYSSIIEFTEPVEILNTVSNSFEILSLRNNSFIIMSNNHNPLSKIPVLINKSKIDTVLISPTINRSIGLIKNKETNDDIFCFTDSVNISFDHILTSVDLSKVKLFKDSLATNIKPRVTKNQLVYMNLTPGSNYTLRIDSASVKTDNSISCSKLLYAFKTYSSEMLKDSVRFQFKNTFTSNFIVKISNNNIEREFYISSNNYNVKSLNFPVGTYQLKVIKDANKNGIWDTGDIYNQIQPEEVKIKSLEVARDKNIYEIEL